MPLRSLTHPTTLLSNGSAAIGDQRAKTGTQDSSWFMVRRKPSCLPHDLVWTLALYLAGHQYILGQRTAGSGMGAQASLGPSRRSVNLTTGGECVYMCACVCTHVCMRMCVLVLTEVRFTLVQNGQTAPVKWAYGPTQMPATPKDFLKLCILQLQVCECSPSSHCLPLVL